MVALLVAITFFSCIYAAAGHCDNANVVSRIGLAHAIAEHGRVTITHVAASTIDKARFGDDYYCDKALGLSFMAVPAVYVVGKLADWSGAAPLAADGAIANGPLCRALVLAATATTTAPLVAIAVGAVYRIGRRVGLTPPASAFGAVVTASVAPRWRGARHSWRMPRRAHC